MVIVVVVVVVDDDGLRVNVKCMSYEHVCRWGTCLCVCTPTHAYPHPTPNTHTATPSCSVMGVTLQYTRHVMVSPTYQRGIGFVMGVLLGWSPWECTVLCAQWWGGRSARCVVMWVAWVGCAWFTGVIVLGVF